ncbi:hypothetical protein [Paenibacillus larvae]|nr:hypothetical protein [Paenibacillus larvae]MDT2194928.1 hypothetical protein [Paenibacillus larvae]
MRRTKNSNEFKVQVVKEALKPETKQPWQDVTSLQYATPMGKRV